MFMRVCPFSFLRRSFGESPLIHNEHGGIVTLHYIYCYVIGVQTPHHFARPYFPCHLK